MTAPPSAGPGTALVDGVDIDAVAAVVRSCAGVSSLDGGPFGEVASYLPGRVVAGVAVDGGRVLVQVRSRWGVPAADLAALITVALAPLTGPRPVDVAIADIDDPPVAELAGAARPAPVVAGRAPEPTWPGRSPQPGGER